MMLFIVVLDCLRFPGAINLCPLHINNYSPPIIIPKLNFFTESTQVQSKGLHFLINL